MPRLLARRPAGWCLRVAAKPPKQVNDTKCIHEFHEYVHELGGVHGMMVGAAGLGGNVAQVLGGLGGQGDTKSDRFMAENDPAGLQALHSLANITTVVLAIRQQHNHPVGRAGVAMAGHVAVGEAQGVRHGRAAARLQAADEPRQLVHVTGEALIAGNRVLAVAAEGQHGHFDGPALRRPAQGGDGGLLGDLNLHVRSAAPDCVPHASRGVNQQQQAAGDRPPALSEGG